MITGISSQARMLALLCANNNVISIYSKQQNEAMAMEYLGKAFAKGAFMKLILNDADLEFLRKTKGFDA